MSSFEERPSWDDTFMNVVEILAKRSTCARMQTASLLARDTRIISMGYNGTFANQEHCVDHWRSRKDEMSALHHEWSTLNEIHAEQNAILYASKTGIPTNGTVLYTLYSPCINCAKVLISAGVEKVVYYHRYERDLKGIDFLKSKGIHVEQYKKKTR